jgi:hypothetical protein
MGDVFASCLWQAAAPAPYLLLKSSLEGNPTHPKQASPVSPLKFNLTYISLGDNIITTSDNGGCYAR